MKKLIKTLSNILLLYSLSFAQPPQWRLASGTEGVYISDIDIYDSNPDTLYATGQQFLISILFSYPIFLETTKRKNEKV